MSSTSGKALSTTTGSGSISIDSKNSSMIINNNAQAKTDYTIYLKGSTGSGISATKEFTLSFKDESEALTEFVPVFVVKEPEVETKDNSTAETKETAKADNETADSNKTDNATKDSNSTSEDNST